jgi:hypothetical protein
LENIRKLKLYKYDFNEAFRDVNGGVKSDYGVIAQEVKEIIPDAVVESSDLVLSNGVVIDKFLHVNKNRLNMECMGALIALGDKAQNLDQKVEKIEETINKYEQFKKKTSIFSQLIISLKLLLAKKHQLNAPSLWARLKTSKPTRSSLL